METESLLPKQLLARLSTDADGHFSDGRVCVGGDGGCEGEGERER